MRKEEFRKKRKGSQLCYPLETRRLPGGGHRNQWNSWPVGTQAKLNGERCRYADGFLLSSTEEPIYSVPHIAEELAWLEPPFELDGELYKHGMSFEEIHSRVSRTTNLHKNFEAIEYHLFDIASDDPSESQLLRAVMLGEWFSQNVPTNSPLKLVKLKLANDYNEVLSDFERYCEQGYEGIIVRNLDAPYVRKRSQFCLKFKPKKQDDYEVIGFEEERDKNGNAKSRLGSVRLKAENGNEFNVYSGFDDELRNALWQQRFSLIGRVLTVYYQALTSDRAVPCFGRVNAKELKLLWSLN